MLCFSIFDRRTCFDGLCRLIVCCCYLMLEDCFEVFVEYGFLCYYLREMNETIDCSMDQCHSFSELIRETHLYSFLMVSLHHLEMQLISDHCLLGGSSSLWNLCYWGVLDSSEMHIWRSKHSLWLCACQLNEDQNQELSMIQEILNNTTGIMLFSSAV